MSLINKEDKTPDVTTATNTTFIDQAPLHVEFAQAEPRLPPAIKDAPDMDWLAAQQLTKPIVIQNLQWNATQTMNTSLWNVSLPDVINSIDSLHSRTLRMYALHRANWVFRFQLNGTRFHQGQLIAAIIPFGLRQAIAPPPNQYGGYSAAGLTGFPSVQISASASSPIELKVPYVHLQHYFATNATNSLPIATIELMVLNPLAFATGSSAALSLTISMYAEDPEVHIPMYDHAPVFEVFEPSSFEIFEPSAKVEEEPGLFSNLGSAIGHLVTGNFKGFFKSGAKAQSQVGDLFDKPAFPTPLQKTISPVSGLSGGKGADTSIRLGLDPMALSVQPLEVFGAVEDQMAMDYVIKKPMLVDITSWSDTNTSGTILAAFPVTPLLSYAEAPTNSPNVWQPTFVAWVASMFAFWRGSMKLRIDAISTSFHTGRLLVAFVPNQFTTANPTITQAYSCPNVIIDIQSATQTEFEIPFVSPTPYKVATATAVSNDAITGYVYVFVLNELVHPDNVASSIQLNVYSYAGEDLEFFVPRSPQVSLGPYTAPPEVFEASAGEELDMAFKPAQQTKTEKVDNAVSLAAEKRDPTKLNRFGEIFPLIDLIKRYVVNSGTNVVSFNITPIDATFIQSGETIPTLGAISMMYACWYGSMRYKFLFPSSRTSPDNVTVQVIPSEIFAISAVAGDPFHATNLAQDCALEVEVPCYTHYAMLTTMPLGSAFAFSKEQYTTSGTFSTTHSAMTPPTPASYMAAGDDLRFYYLIAPPSCTGQFIGKII